MKRLMTSTIAILHQEISDGDDASQQDVLVQRDAIQEVLERLGHSVVAIPCTLDLAGLQSELRKVSPVGVFNLVESLGGTDHLMPLVPLLLEAEGIPFTGSGSRAIINSGDKLVSKRLLRQACLPTPSWLQKNESTFESFQSPQKVIIKAVSEHASFGMDDECVQTVCSAAELQGAVTQRDVLTGKPHFAEQFISGREFNLSLLQGEEGPICLPPAEIDFSQFSADQPQIVGYRAKWVEDSPEYQQTPRFFPSAEEDQPLRNLLQRLAVHCWNLFELRGYARVDFRVDENQQPWILEINANPCLSPDAGFAAALAEAEISYDDAIRLIVECS